MTAQRVPPGRAHEVMVRAASARSTYGRNAGRVADLCNPAHYPVTAVCSVCGLKVRRQKIAPGELDWMH